MDENNPITVLSEAEAWELLKQQTLGRLAISVAGEPDIFPVNYVVHDGKILFRTGAGTKLAGAVAHDTVAFEIDSHSETEATSVVVKGTAELVENYSKIYEADDAGLIPWVPTLKYNYVYIHPTEVSGRHFDLGKEPDRYNV